MYATPFYTGICVGCECGGPYRFKHLHYCPLHDTVTIWELVNLPAFRLILDKYGILRGCISPSLEFFLQLPQVVRQVCLELYNLIAFPFALTCVIRCEQKVFHRAKLLKYETFAFHWVFGSLGLTGLLCIVRSFRGLRPTNTLFVSCNLLPRGKAHFPISPLFLSRTAKYRGDE